MKPFLLLTLLVVSITVNAQTDTLPPAAPVVKPVKKTISTILAGAVFAPRLHYYGRTDSLKSSALLPTLLIQFDSIGIYASGTSVFLNNRIQSMEYAGTIAELGYKFGKYKGLTGNVYVSKFFYNTTQLPQSALKAQAGTNLAYLTKPVNITLTGSAAFSDKTDFFASGGLNHNFKWIKGKSVLVITPTAVANAGSQNFTNTYYKQNIPGLHLPPQEVTENSKRFTLLSYDFSLPVVYAYKGLFLIATPTYVVPDNVIKVPNHPELSETASNLFFVNLTALYSFRIRK
jgi:hypothetical protein